MNDGAPKDVGLALVATPWFFVAQRHVGKRRPHARLNGYRQEESYLPGGRWG